MSASRPSVSVVMRSHNDRAYIESTLASFRSQRFQDFELLSCDDSSTDGTAECLREYPGVRMLSRPAGSYVPGKTLNNALLHCRGEIVVFNNADAVPCGSDYLDELLKPLLSDPGIVAVYGNQLSRDDASMLVRRDNERAFGDGKLAASWGNFFSLASSAIRLSSLRAYPFDEGIQYSEDVEWTHRARLRGEQIVYCAKALVVHSHNYTLAQLRKRFYNEGRADGRIYGKVPGLLRCCRRWAMEVMRDIGYLCARGGYGELLESPVRRYIQIFAHRSGCRDYLREK